MGRLADEGGGVGQVGVAEQGGGVRGGVLTTSRRCLVLLVVPLEAPASLRQGGVQRDAVGLGDCAEVLESGGLQGVRRMWSRRLRHITMYGELL